MFDGKPCMLRTQRIPRRDDNYYEAPVTEGN